MRRRRRKPKKDGKGYNRSLDITFGDISRQAEEAVGYGKPPKPEPSEEPEAAANAEQAVQDQTENKETEETPQRQGIKLEDLLRMQSRNNNNNGNGDGDGEGQGQGQQTLFPGMLGNQERQQQSDEITEEKIKELLEKYGTGPPKTDNLPKMPRIGLRVTTGPDWMWNQNGIPLNAVGTVISIDEEEEGKMRISCCLSYFLTFLSLFQSFFQL